MWEHFSHASKLSNALEDYGARTYGWPGQSALPFEAVRTLDAALQIIAEHLVRHDEALKTNTAKIGTTQGSKGGLLARINGTPVQRFLQRFRNIWVAASGKEVLGEPFETAAKTLLEIALPPNRSGWRRELGDLGRQIKNAKKRGYEVKTEWDAINDIENMDLNALQYRRE